MVRQLHLIAVVSTFLMVVLVVGCAAGDPGIYDGRAGKRGAAAKEETTASEGDRSKVQTAQEPVGLDAQVVSPPDQGNLPAGFGEGALWATGETISAGPSGRPSASASASASPPGATGAGGGPGGPPQGALREAGPADRRGGGNDPAGGS